MSRPTSPSRRTDESHRSDLVWPVGIAIALSVVVLVNVVFVFMAVSGADAVAESYESGER